MDVYIAARDLAGVPIGTHQFIIIVITYSPYPVARLLGRKVYAQPLGKMKMGYVIGAQNRGELSGRVF